MFEDISHGTSNQQTSRLDATLLVYQKKHQDAILVNGHIRLRYWLLMLILAFYLLPLSLSAFKHWLDTERPQHWQQARNDSTQLAPPPGTTPEAVVQVYSARAFRWRGIFGTHTWIALKRPKAEHYTRLEVIGWGVRRGAPAVRSQITVAPDGYWFGAYPDLLVEHRGLVAEEIIEQLLAAIKEYPYHHEYQIWPGPNSNTFVAYLARKIPQLQVDLPPTAIGKDHLGEYTWFDQAPSGTGLQVSLGGYLGLLLAPEEGLEINLLGLSAGMDFLDPALRLPGLGRVGG